MKKLTKIPAHKLALLPETLRRLSDRELRVAHGGHIPTDANVCGPPLPSWELNC
jgi:hypothetical protein